MVSDVPYFYGDERDCISPATFLAKFETSVSALRLTEGWDENRTIAFFKSHLWEKPALVWRVVVPDSPDYKNTWLFHKNFFGEWYIKNYIPETEIKEREDVSVKVKTKMMIDTNVSVKVKSVDTSTKTSVQTKMKKETNKKFIDTNPTSVQTKMKKETNRQFIDTNPKEKLFEDKPVTEKSVTPKTITSETLTKTSVTEKAVTAETSVETKPSTTTPVEPKVITKTLVTPETSTKPSVTTITETIETETSMKLSVKPLTETIETKTSTKPSVNPKTKTVEPSVKPITETATKPSVEIKTSMIVETIPSETWNKVPQWKIKIDIQTLIIFQLMLSVTTKFCHHYNHHSYKPYTNSDPKQTQRKIERTLGCQNHIIASRTRIRKRTFGELFSPIKSRKNYIFHIT